MTTFSLFKDFKKNAPLSDKSCEPGHLPPFLDGNYFDGEYTDQGVCLDCLTNGRKVVTLDAYMQAKIKKNARTPEEIETITRILQRTPPVPWIQYNDWPFCDHEPMQYVGEFSKDKTLDDAERIGIPQRLWEMADENGKKQAGDARSLLDSIQDGITACFIFKCLKCERYEAVCQSY